MRMIVHDLPAGQFEKLFPAAAGEYVVTDDGTIRPCCGCFGCWIKTPGQCVLKDRYSVLPVQLAKSSGLITICQGTYGGLNPFVKNVLDRSIGYLHPNFTIRGREMHHQMRYRHLIQWDAWFYGEMSERERQLAEKLIRANGINFQISPSVHFVREAGEVRL